MSLSRSPSLCATCCHRLMHEYSLRGTCCHRRLTNGYYVRFVFALHFCCLLSVGLSFVSGYLVMIVHRTDCKIRSHFGSCPRFTEGLQRPGTPPALCGAVSMGETTDIAAVAELQGRDLKPEDYEVLANLPQTAALRMRISRASSRRSGSVRAAGAMADTA